MIRRYTALAPILFLLTSRIGKFECVAHADTAHITASENANLAKHRILLTQLGYMVQNRKKLSLVPNDNLPGNYP